MTANSKPSAWIDRVMELAGDAMDSCHGIGWDSQCHESWRDAELAKIRAVLTQQAATATSLADALENYRAAFGQGLDAYGIPYGPQQVQADEQAIAALEPYRSHSNITGEQA